MSWDVVGKFANVENIAFGAITAVGFAAKMFVRHVESSDLLLKDCENYLGDVRKALKSLTPEERDLIRALTKRGAGGCKSLEEIEESLRRLGAALRDLSKQSVHSDIWDRNMPYTSLRTDIKSLRKLIASLRDDTWNTTALPNNSVHQSPPPPHPCPPPPAVPKPPVSAQFAPSAIGWPEAYPLNDIGPATAYKDIIARDDVKDLPPGLV